MLKNNQLLFWRLGVRNKLMALFIISGIIPMFLIGYYGYNSTAESLTENILTHDSQQVNNEVEAIKEFLVAIPRNLNFFSNFFALEQWLQWRNIGEPYKTQQWLKYTQATFYSFLNSRKIYRQIQVLDLQGQELLRIEYDLFQDRTVIIEKEQLEDRRQAEYFNHAITLKKGQVYLVPLQRYEQYDLERKYQNVLHYSTPLVDNNNQTQGVLALSLYTDSFLQFLDTANNRGHSGEATSYYSLLDRYGEYLYQPFELPHWGFATQSHTSLAIQAPRLFSELTNRPLGTLAENKVLTTFERVYPLAEEATDYYWIVTKQTQEDAAFAKVLHFQYLFLSTLVLVTMIIWFLISWFTKRLLTPLLQVNNQLKAIAIGQLVEEHIDYKKADEIGELVMSAWQLKNSISGTITQANAIAAGDYSREIVLLSEQDQLGRALSHMTRTLREITATNALQTWLKTTQTQLHEQMSGEQDTFQLGENIIHFLVTSLQAQMGLIYFAENGKAGHIARLKLIASYAYARRKQLITEVELGEGLVGQTALERESILITQIPPDYIPIQSGLGEAQPRQILLVPFFYETLLKGVVELATLGEFSAIQREFLQQVMPNIGITVHTAQSRSQLQELLQQTQTMAEELQSQQEELRQTNEELEERTQELERQQEEIRQKNSALQESRTAAETKARELELASRYKSEFLANMSHELRTPLNSLLILAQLLGDNKDGNLTGKQVEYAKTIHSAGSDLLFLINDILDLSKVEAGKMEIHVEEVLLTEFLATIEQKFRPLAEKKAVAFQLVVAEEIPEIIYTDAQRLKQIINNLLSNAFKFTTQGEVKLEINTAGKMKASPNNISDKLLTMSVTDTGIGIPADKQKIIFEAFQQVDGSTSRRYGGTGLGLSISRQLARLLGGDIELVSEINKGSCFTLYLPNQQPTVGAETLMSHATPPFIPTIPITTPPPSKPTISAIPSFTATIPITTPPPSKPTISATPPPFPTPNPVDDKQPPPIDDRTSLQTNDKFILVIEDDRKFSTILMELAREKGFKCLLAEDGKTGLQLAEGYQPHAIILDVGLPKIDGWTVMERLKDNPQTRHIPVHFMSATDESMQAKQMGAIGYLLKPVNMSELGEAFKKIEKFIANAVKKLLIVVDKQERQQQILELIGNDDIQITKAIEINEAWQALQQHSFDCLIIDIDVEMKQGFTLLKWLHQEGNFSQLPVIVYAERELSPEEEACLQQCMENLTVKTVKSPERLLDEAILFLHQMEADLSSEKRQMIRMVHDKEAILRAKKVLIVDDDMRNTFALATVLEEKEMEVVVAKTGKEALTALEKQPNIDIVLMDVMMPEMDGYEAMKLIRAQAHYHRLPIIALTAKAMKGDKAKCIEAGASDYLSKPVDMDKLVSLMRVWLYR
jgi:signal transduction histidine kinase/CheY-like chemotaxis protein